MKNMPRIGVLAAGALIAIGVGLFVGTGSVQKTALIPAWFGIPLLIASVISFKECRLKMGMHIAATLGLLGFVMPVGMLASKAAKGALELKTSTYGMAGMALVCGIFVALCVKSFIDVRKAREAAEPKDHTKAGSGC